LPFYKGRILETVSTPDERKTDYDLGFMKIIVSHLHAKSEIQTLNFRCLNLWISEVLKPSNF